jgi:nucleotide-binding universal stress UspA family protein
MDEISRARQIQASFRVVRGHVESELLSAADDVDLMALGRLGHSVARRARLGSTAWAATTRSGRPVLLVRPDGDLARPVVVVDDATEAGARGFAAAAGLLRRVGSGRAGELKVLIWAADDESAYERRQLLVEALGQAGVQADFQHFHDAGGERLLELINRQDGGLLVLPVDPSGLPEETVRSLLENARQHVLVIH